MPNKRSLIRLAVFLAVVNWSWSGSAAVESRKTGETGVGVIQGCRANCSNHPILNIKKVAFDDLAQHSPTDVERMSTEEREEILQTRRQTMMQRRHWLLHAASRQKSSRIGQKPMNTENLARSYYRRVNAKDIEGLLTLFADDACFVLPDGRNVEGVEAIRGMYKNVFAQGGPQPKPVAFVSGENAVAVEVEVHLADGTVRQMASFFQIDDQGKITSVGVYRRTEG